MTFEGAPLRKVATAILTAIRFQTEVNCVVMPLQVTLELEIFAADVTVEGGRKEWVGARVSIY